MSVASHSNHETSGDPMSPTKSERPFKLSTLAHKYIDVHSWNISRDGMLASVIWRNLVTLLAGVLPVTVAPCSTASGCGRWTLMDASGNDTTSFVLPFLYSTFSADISDIPNCD